MPILHATNVDLDRIESSFLLEAFGLSFYFPRSFFFDYAPFAYKILQGGHNFIQVGE